MGPLNTLSYHPAACQNESKHNEQPDTVSSSSVGDVPREQTKTHVHQLSLQSHQNQEAGPLTMTGLFITLFDLLPLNELYTK